MAQKKSALTELKKKNDEKSYRAWLSESGASPQGERLDAIASAKVDAAFNSRSRGASLESLANGNLQRSGYADYLKSQDIYKTEHALSSADEVAAITELKNLSGYGKYLAKYNAIQEDIKKQVTDILVEDRCFDKDKAYRYAMGHGLSEENANLVATNATRLSMERVTKDAINYARKYDFSKDLAKKYAKRLGLNEYYSSLVADGVYRYYDDASAYYESLNAEEYENIVTSKK